MRFPYNIVLIRNKVRELLLRCFASYYDFGPRTKHGFLACSVYKDILDLLAVPNPTLFEATTLPVFQFFLSVWNLGIIVIRRSFVFVWCLLQVNINWGFSGASGLRRTLGTLGHGQRSKSNSRLVPLLQEIWFRGLHSGLNFLLFRWGGHAIILLVLVWW